MNVQQLQQLIQEIVTTFVQPKKRLLIVHPHTTISLKQMETLSSYCTVEEWQEGTDATNIPQMFYDAIVFLEVDQVFIIASAQGLPNSPATLFLADLLLRGEPAVLVPQQKMAEVMTAKQPNAYSSMLQKHMESLKTFGCDLQLFSQLIPSIKATRQDLSFADQQTVYITEEMIRTFQGQQLVIPATTRLTPLALDVLQEKGITIQRK
ncbi:hypothetical protein I6G82_09155 [Lysinibacillus macroides]|uniref:Ethanolamine utilization protein n=1 Tax=Lysinibacillus macroides TaxID=33935 RepID=A0A0M9DI12_9BACI|nr:hypothetical protein [Lysinibacillus macroides]KOY80592.1 hypothetical protein ADM90_15405 [Lysinibacillus macroides]QPR69729.1 hypothetical protein I6G82_09155 [Lysinibacillus macroides]